MKNSRLAALLFVLFASVAGLLLRDFQRPSFTGDGVGYYAPLASWLADGDLELGNELSHLNPAFLRAAFMTPEGRLGNPFPVGPAILWAPAVYLGRFLPPARVLDAPLSLATQTMHPEFAPRFARMVLWTGMALLLVGGACLAWALARIFWPPFAAACVLVGVVGTPVFFYVLQDPSYGHTASFFATSLLVTAVLVDRERRVRLETLGFLWGFAALVRSQDVLLGALLVPRLLEEWRVVREMPRRALAVTIVRVALPALLAFLPQMLFWTRIYGTPLLVPPGPDFVPAWKPQVFPFLFSTWNGAFVWSPVLLIGIAGLFTMKDRSLRIAFLVAIALELYSCSVILDWWGGRAFGARRLVSIVPLVATGLACLFAHLRHSRRKRVALAAALILACFWNVRLAEYHRFHLLPQNPGNARDYVRHYQSGSKNTHRYGYWDYGRLLAEIVDSERMVRAIARRERDANIR